MDITQIIDRLSEFFEHNPPAPNSKVVERSFMDLLDFDYRLAEELLQNPEDFIRAGQIALESDTPSTTSIDRVDVVDRVDKTLPIPDWCYTSKTKLLYLLSDDKILTLEELPNLLNVTKSGVSKILVRKDGTLGVVDGGLCQLVDNPDSVNSKSIKITQRGKEWFLDFKKAQVSPESDVQVVKSHVEVRFINLPKSAEVLIPDLRAHHLNKFISIVGIVRQRSEVRPQVTHARFECPSCGNTMTVLQLDKKFREPTKCSCGRKGRFRLMSKELMDVRTLTLKTESSVDDAQMSLFLQRELCNIPIPLGSRLKVNGILKEVPILAKDGGKLVRMDIILEVNSIEFLEEVKLNITDEDRKNILEFSKTHGENTLHILSNKFATNVEGNFDMKKAILLQAVSCKDPAYPDVDKRLAINLALYGLPGGAKSQIAKKAIELSAKSIYIDCSKASSVGLTASVQKDEFIGGYTLEAGAIPLAGNGIAILDELDKVHPEQSQVIAEPMESGKITVAKANVYQSIDAPAKILALGNFVEGMDTSKMTPKLLNIRPQVWDRMDLIFRSEQVSSDALGKRILRFIKDSKEDTLFVRKYIYHALNHKISYFIEDEKCQEKLINFFHVVRVGAQDSGFFFSARLLESLRRLAYASAKLRLAPCVEMCDVDISISLMKSYLRDIGYQFVLTDALKV